MPGEASLKVAQAHREPSLVERVKLHETRPGLIEHDVFAKAADALDNALGVVDRAVIGALLDHRDPERPLALPGVRILDQRVVADALADRRLVELLGANRTDESVGVAVGRKIDRDPASHEQRALMRRLVVVAVEQHQVALGDQIGQHDLVRGRGAVEDEIGLLGAEDGGGLFLRLQSRPLMGQEVAELEDRIVEVVAKDRLAQMLDEDAADRAAAVEDAAVVARASPELIAFLLVVDERAEEWGLERVGILLEARDEVAGDEFGRLLGQEDVAIDEVEHLDRNVLEALAPDEDDNRHVEAALAHQVDERGGLALDAFLAPVDDHAADCCVGLHGDLGVFDAARLDHLKAEPFDGGNDLVDPETLEIVGVEHRRREEEGQTLGKVHRVWPVFGWAPSRRPFVPTLGRGGRPERLLKTASTDRIKSGPKARSRRGPRASAKPSSSASSALSFDCHRNQLRFRSA